MTEIEKGSGNVFADLGFPDAEAHQLKAMLVVRITRLIKSQGLSQVEAAQQIGMSPPDLSRMLKGQFRTVPLEKLIRCIMVLGDDVEISVRSPGKQAKVGRTHRLGRIKVRAA